MKLDVIITVALLACPRCGADPPAPPQAPDETTCIGETCFSNVLKPEVEYLQPTGGEIYGGTPVVAYGRGFRDFGTLMRCKFGPEVSRIPTSLAGCCVTPAPVRAGSGRGSHRARRRVHRCV